MQIRILGTRGMTDASAPWHAKHSGVLVDDQLLFDLGEPAFLAEHEPRAIFITHLHPDHAAFVETEMTIDIPVHVPEPTDQIESEVLDEGIEIAGYQVTPFPTHHSKLVESQAYLVEKGGARLLYTGDLVWLNKTYHDQLRGLDLVITDGAYWRKGGLIRSDEAGNLWGHNGIPDLVDLFGPLTARIVFTHFGAWFYEDIEEARKKVADLSNPTTQVEVARDGQVFELSEGDGDVSR